MKKNENKYANTLCHAEIYNFALSYLGEKCRKGVDTIKTLETSDEITLKAAKSLYAPWFFKAKKLCEMYYMETGTEYDGLAAGFGIEMSDLDID